jgi:hypothetical protein
MQIVHIGGKNISCNAKAKEGNKKTNVSKITKKKQCVNVQLNTYKAETNWYDAIKGEQCKGENASFM